MSTGPTDPYRRQPGANPPTSPSPSSSLWEQPTYVGPPPVFNQPPMYGPPPRRRRTGLVVALVAVALIVTGGATVGAVFAVKHHNKTVAAQHARDAAKARDAAHAKAIKTCQAQIGAFVGDLRDLDAKLDVGMNEGDYGEAVQAASVDHAHVNPAALSAPCRSAFDLAGKALSTYASIDEDWNDCITDYSCDTDTGVDYSGWLTCTTQIKQAYAAMNTGRAVGAPGRE